jgi:hypothetical protein
MLNYQIKKLKNACNLMNNAAKNWRTVCKNLYATIIE